MGRVDTDNQKMVGEYTDKGHTKQPPTFRLFLASSLHSSGQQHNLLSNLNYEFLKHSISQTFEFLQQAENSRGTIRRLITPPGGGFRY